VTSGETPTAILEKTAMFPLELYYERDSDGALAEDTAKRLTNLLHSLAPHVVLAILVLRADRIVRSRFSYEAASHDVPNHLPTCALHQSLLITNEEIGAAGWAGPGQGCVSKERIAQKVCTGADSADITLHEWLHTIEGLKINGRTVPDPHQNAEFGFPEPSGHDADGGDTWHDWYRYMLRGR
jgi:hypothetical protein